MHQPNPGTLVGLYSPYPGAGKSTVADMLVREHGFVRVKVADGLKAMLRSLLAYQNLPLCKIDEMIEGGLKHQVSAYLMSKTPRHTMQTLGTEWGRDCMGEDFWVEVADAKVRALVRDGKSVVIDDIRFENEYDYVRRYAGIMAHIRRPSLEAARLCFSGFSPRTIRAKAISKRRNLIFPLSTKPKVRMSLLPKRFGKS
jgi:hypothetical protein